MQLLAQRIVKTPVLHNCGDICFLSYGFMGGRSHFLAIYRYLLHFSAGTPTAFKSDSSTSNEGVTKKGSFREICRIDIIDVIVFHNSLVFEQAVREFLTFA